MAQAVVDPGELRRFATNLKRFNAELQNNLSVLHGQMISLGDSWRDQEHIKFVQEFEQTLHVLERFMESVNLHVPYLNRKAERVEEYLHQKQGGPMSQSARVNSIEALRDWKNALVACREDSQESLNIVELEIRRMFDWLDDQHKFWEAEVRRRDDQVVVAKADLTRRKMLPTVSGRPPDTVEHEKALRKAQRLLEEAQEKVEKTRRWVPLLHRAADEYQAQGRRLANLLEDDVPRATARLEQRIIALEDYVAMSAPVPPQPATPPAKPSPPSPTAGSGPRKPS